MNIYKFELKQLKKSILLWGIVVPLSLFIYLSFFPMIASNGESFMGAMESFPEELLAAFGMTPELPMNTVIGYFSLTFTIVQIPLAIQAGNYGFNILSVEERELTADFIFTKPVKRRKIYFAKFLSAFTALTIVNIILWLSSLLAVFLFKSDDVVAWKHLNVLLSSTVFFQLFFLSIGMLISMLVKKIRSVISFSMALGFGTYIISSMGTIVSSGVLQYFTPYSYFQPKYILVEGTYNWPLTFVCFGVIAVSLVSSYFLYIRRNIASL